MRSSDLVQDAQSTMGLAMTARVKLTPARLNDWIGWEPVLRALLDGRKVHETGDVTFTDLDGATLDLDRSFTIDDDREEIAHFLERGRLPAHPRRVRRRRDGHRSAPTSTSGSREHDPDDGESWWAEDEDGVDAGGAGAVLLRQVGRRCASLVHDDRYQWIGDLTGDGHIVTGVAAKGS